MQRIEAGSVELLSSITCSSSSHTDNGSNTECPMALTSQLVTMLKTQREQSRSDLQGLQQHYTTNTLKIAAVNQTLKHPL